MLEERKRRRGSKQRERERGNRRREREKPVCIHRLSIERGGLPFPSFLREVTLIYSLWWRNSIWIKERGEREKSKEQPVWSLSVLTALPFSLPAHLSYFYNSLLRFTSALFPSLFFLSLSSSLNPLSFSFLFFLSSVALLLQKRNSFLFPPRTPHSTLFRSSG